MKVGDAIRRIQLDLVRGRRARRPRERPEVGIPGERARLDTRRRLTGYVAAVALPTAVALAILPLRAEHSQIVPLILVIPVVVIAAFGALGPAVVAALTAGIAYDVAHTEPYWRLVIHDRDDVVTAIALVVVAVVVGGLCSRVVHLAARAATRGAELRHLMLFAKSAADELDADDLASEVCGRLTGLLHLRECRWHPGYHGTAGPVLLPTGAVMGYMSALNPDRALLPQHLEVPAVSGTRDFGRFVLEPDGRTVVSSEERLTAAVIVDLFAARIAATES
jgi:K+-sensing histidine kinase KdpD